ncbi:MAG: hypothetical protein PS018_04560, partial [bacterium]|nr:hypothetical protein [bacterium]
LLTGPPPSCRIGAEDFSGTKPVRVNIMLRMLLVGLLIPLGIGVLTVMELNTPPRKVAAAEPPTIAMTTDAASPANVLAKTDRLEVASLHREISMTETTRIEATRVEPIPAAAPAAPVARAEEPAPPPAARPSPVAKAPAIAPRRAEARPKPVAKPKKVETSAVGKPRPKIAEIKHPPVPERPKAVANAESCRLSAFGGLRKALNMSSCEL